MTNPPDRGSSSPDIFAIDNLTTESVNQATLRIDSASALEIVRLMNAEDATAVAAVRHEAESIAAVIDTVANAFRNGGRLIYMGAGTSGRLGVLDASECPPTFGSDPSQVIGLIAGGERALRNAVEGAEDNPDQGAADLKHISLNQRDVVVAIASSGRTPYCIGGLQYARQVGAKCVALVCNRPSALDAFADIIIAPIVGPEVIAGSTRLKAGTATKLVLNTITTGAMIRIGKTYGNRMVDLKPLNQKLQIRSRRILREIAGINDNHARDLLDQTKGLLKPAIVMAMTGADAVTAIQLLQRYDGHVRSAIGAVETREIPRITN